MAYIPVLAEKDKVSLVMEGDRLTAKKLGVLREQSSEHAPDLSHCGKATLRHRQYGRAYPLHSLIERAHLSICRYWVNAVPYRMGEPCVEIV